MAAGQFLGHIGARAGPRGIAPRSSAAIRSGTMVVDHSSSPSPADSLSYTETDGEPSELSLAAVADIADEQYRVFADAKGTLALSSAGGGQHAPLGGGVEPAIGYRKYLYFPVTGLVWSRTTERRDPTAPAVTAPPVSAPPPQSPLRPSGGGWPRP